MIHICLFISTIVSSSLAMHYNQQLIALRTEIEAHQTKKIEKTFEGLKPTTISQNENNLLPQEKQLRSSLRSMPLEINHIILKYALPGNSIFLHLLMYTHKKDEDTPLFPMEECIAQKIVRAIIDKNNKILTQCYDTTLGIHFNKDKKEQQILRALYKSTLLYKSAPAYNRQQLLKAFIPHLQENFIHRCLVSYDNTPQRAQKIKEFKETDAWKNHTDLAIVYPVAKGVKQPGKCAHSFSKESVTEPHQTAFALFLHQNSEHSILNKKASLICWGLDENDMEKIAHATIPELKKNNRDLNNCYIQ